MKFFIAASILAQTLPAISEQSSSSELLAHDVDFGRVLANAANPAAKQERRKARKFQARKAAGRRLTNSPLASGKICDPLSDDPDVGILSCNAGYECVVDQASSLGGHCISTSRNLQTYYYCDLCGAGFRVGPGNRENPANVAGYDGATCGDMYDLAYYVDTPNITISDATCVAFAAAAKVDDCCTPFCTLCSFGSYIVAANYDIKLDLSAVGLGQSTCGDVVYAAYTLAAIDEETCPMASQLAIDGGCCTEPTIYNCTICGDAEFFENDTVISSFGGEYSCGEVQPYLSPAYCTSPNYVTSCCGVVVAAPTATPQESESPVSAPPVSAPPSMSPDMGMDGDGNGTTTTSPPTSTPTNAPPPTSDSATMWSSSTLVSMMGLAAVSAGSLIVLN